MENLIIIKSVFRDVGQKYFIWPCRNPRTGQYPPCVRRVRGEYPNTEMILSDEDIDQMNKGLAHFVPEDKHFTIVPGSTFNLDDIVEKANWEAIMYSPNIAKDRDERDENGVLVIDGNAKKYGKCELYVERPGKAAENKNKYRHKKNIAETYIFDDTMESRITKCKVLGRNMRQRPDSDIIDYLLNEAEKNPDKIIDLYTGEDFQIRLQLAEAVEKRVVLKKNGVFYYDEIPLGATEDACLIWFKDPRNRKIADMIRSEIYPELAKREVPEPPTPKATKTAKS